LSKETQCHWKNLALSCVATARQRLTRLTLKPAYRVCSRYTLSLWSSRLTYVLVLVTELLQHRFNGLFSRTAWVSRYQKGKTSLDLNEARDDGVLGCSGISWTICKQSAPRCRQITTPTPHHSIFTGLMLLLTPDPLLHTPCISSPNHHLFAAHAIPSQPVLL